MPFPICPKHAIAVYMRVAEIRQDALSGGQRLGFIEQSLEPKALDLKDVARSERQQTIYYVRVGDLIKIGWTTDLRTRLRAYGPARQLLATETGGSGLEAQRHREFNHLLVAGKEWFRPGSDLLEHIATISNTDVAALEFSA
jgi:hypothetical protein